MSKDQLSWEQLLNGEIKNAESEAADAPTIPASDEVKSAPKTFSKTKKKKATKEEPATLYSKKDWGKLEFKTSESTAIAEKPVETVEAKATSNKATAKNATKTQVEITKTPAKTESKQQFVSEPGADQEPQVMSVSELNRNIRDILEGRFPLLWLKGEISNFKAHTSGHFYFSLKDAKAQISAVMFRGFNSQLRFRPEDGMEVLVRGKVTVYEPRGNYQIFCEVLEPVGAGALQKAFEQLKAKLQAEGLFDEARKRPIPGLPRHIAIVTSPTGAAIRDMLNVLARRFKSVRITLIPCKVQGDQAPKEICAAIELANRLNDVDVMIVGRGGGSIEDLWGFNDERVARAIATARVPVISAVGHEVDFTIADFVADLRAPTPSAAAELVVKNAADLQARVTTLSRGLRYGVLRRLNFTSQACTALSKRLIDPQRRIQDAALRCDELLHRLHAGVLRLVNERRLRLQPIRMQLKNEAQNLLTKKRERLELGMAVLDSLSPLKVLDRGYSMVVVDGKIVTNAADLEVGKEVAVRMCRGSIEAQVTKIEPDKR